MSNDDQFERKVKASLDANLGALDANTRNRLAEGRRQAINQKPQRSAWLNFNQYLPVGAVALCSLFAIFLMLNPQDNPVQVLQNDQVAAFELLNNAEEFDAMTDPDFYAWIDEDLNESSADDDV